MTRHPHWISLASLPTDRLQGTYNVNAEVKTKDGELVTCLKAEIAFHR